MSEADAKIRREQAATWQRWQMTELDPRRRKGAANERAATHSQDRAKGDAPGPEGAQPGDPGANGKAGSAAGRAAGPAGAQRPGQRQGSQNTEQQKHAERAAQQAALDAERKRAQEAARKQGHAEGLQAGHAEGYAKGLEEGRKAAQEELEQRIKSTLKPVRNLAVHFSDALALLNDEMAKDLVELALATGRQLAAEALHANPTQVVDLVRGLLHSEPAMHGKPRLWLHPQDHELVSEYLGKELSAAGWALQPDDQVSRGGCRVTSATGELDATWESRWQAVRQQVRSRRSASEQAAAAQALLDAANAKPEPPQEGEAPAAEPEPAQEGEAPAAEPESDATQARS